MEREAGAQVGTVRLVGGGGRLRLLVWVCSAVYNNAACLEIIHFNFETIKRVRGVMNSYERVM